MDSNIIFGINTGPENQLQVKKVATCSPFHAYNYFDQTFEAPSAGGYTIWNFWLGGLTIEGAASNATFSYNTHAKQDRVGYQLYSVYTLNDHSWRPIPALNVPNSGVTAFFLSQNSISYKQPVTDIWFSATKVPPGSARDLYEPDQDTNVLVCTEQYQLQTPTGARSILGSIPDLAQQYQQIGLNAYQEAIATRIMLALDLASTFNTVTHLGPSALLANDHVFELVGTTLPDDQWKREVEGWFQTSLARMQYFVVEWASAMEDLGPFGYYASPDKASNKTVDQAAVHLCSLQRVRNTGEYQTFYFAGVLITVCVGLASLTISWILDWAVGWARRHGRPRHPWRETARIADNKLQLLRKNLVVDEADSTTGTAYSSGDAWDDIEDSMPVAKPGIRFLVPQRKDGDYHYGYLVKDSAQRPQSTDSGPAHEPTGGETRIGSESVPNQGMLAESVPLQTLKRPEHSVESTSGASSESQRVASEVNQDRERQS